jgi:fibronectin-binding autotransporter adhesin
VTINSTINGTTTFASTLGTISASGDQTWANNSSQNFVVASGVQIGNKNTLTLSGSGSGTISGIISQAGNGSGSNTSSLAKTGTGSFTLTGANTYTGGTAVSGGTLFVNNTTGSGTGTGAVTVNTTGTLGGSGTITGAVTVSGSTAAISPGATAGAINTLNINNGGSTALTLTSSKFIVDMTSTTADQINVTGGISLSAATLQLNIPNGTTFTTGQQFVLINNDSTDAISGTFSNAPTGTDLIAGYFWNVSYTGGTGNDFVLTAAIPEPSTWFAGGLALAALIYAQRRRMRSAIRRSPRA